LRPTPSIVNIYSIDMTKYQEGFSAESRYQSVGVLGSQCICPVLDHRADLAFFNCFCVCRAHFLLPFPWRMALQCGFVTVH
jgi:hypothetical protein